MPAWFTSTVFSLRWRCPALSARAPAFLLRRSCSPSMPLISKQECHGEVHRDQPVRRLCRADVGDVVVAWVITIGLRRFAARFGLLRHVWHPAVFVFSAYVIVSPRFVLAFAR